MIKLSTTQLWVHDQDEALAFYTQKLGFEVRMDVDAARDGGLPLADRRPGRPAGHRDRADGDPRPAGHGRRDTAEQVRDLMAKGFAGTIFLTTDDCQAAYEELKARGVEFVEKPEERPYGIDSAFRDPSGQPHPTHPGPRARGGLTASSPSTGAGTMS